MLCALIMAGGKGTRFWPLSTEERPKQFLKLLGDQTMLQMTVNRIQPIVPLDRIFVCTAEQYVDIVKEQLPNLLEENIIIEPEGRNTAPCITLSTFIINKRYPNTNVVVLPSDHLIRDNEAFRQIIVTGDRYIINNKESILTIGMMPNRPETGYGYIKTGNLISQINNIQICNVEMFVEKPNLVKANQYLNEGGYLWNGGMFIWNTQYILNQLEKYATITYNTLKEIEKIEENIQEFINEVYRNTEAISIDYAVLEKSDSIYVIPSEFGWDDIGTWNSVERYKEKDNNNNIINNNVKVFNSSSNMAINNNKQVVMIGVENLMYIETDDSVYLVHKDQAEQLKEYKALL